MRELADERRLLTCREAAAQLGVHRDTLRRAVKSGAIDAVRIRERGNLRFRVTDVEALIAGRTEQR